MPATDRALNERITRAFATLHYDRKVFDPKNPEPLRKYIRKISFDLHPDRCPEDRKGEATLRFQEMQEAFNLIMDNLQSIPGASHSADARARPRSASSVHVPDEYVGKRMMDSMAKEENWDRIVYCAKKIFYGSRGLTAYAVSVLENNAFAVVEAGQKGTVEYFFMNTGSRETKVCILKWLSSGGRQGQAIDLVDLLAEKRDWATMTRCAVAFRQLQPELSGRAIAILEANASSAIAGGDEDAMLFLWKNSGSEWIRGMAMEGLVKAGNSSAISAMLNSLATGRKWAELLSLGMSLPEDSDLRKMAARLAERGLERALAGAEPAAVLFLWDGMTSGRTRNRILDWLVEAGDFDSVRRILDSMGRRGEWAGIVDAASRLPPGNASLKEHALIILKAGLRRIISSGNVVAIEFIYGNSPGLGHAMFTWLSEAGRHEEAEKLLDAMARHLAWDSIAEEASAAIDDRLRAHALSLLERNSKKVLAAASLDTVAFLCRSTGSDSLVASALKALQPSEAGMVLDIMAERGMWKEIKDAAPRFAGGTLWDHSLALLEENSGSVMSEGRADVILFLWEHAPTKGTRESMMRELVAAGNVPAVKQMLELMARRKMWKALTYCSETVLSGHPELRRHSLYLMESNVYSIRESGAGEALAFLSLNTRRKGVLDAVEGKPQPGVYQSFARKVRGLWDARPTLRTA